MRTQLNETEFLALGLSTLEYQCKDIESARILLDEVTKYHPASLLFEVHEETDYKDNKATYFDRAIVLLTHPELHLEISFSSYRKQYSINCRSFNLLKNTNSNTIENIKRTLTAPNHIGKLTDKKILQWVNYYEEIFMQAKKENEKNGEAKAEFLKSIEGLPVQWNADKKGGRIIRNGIELTFTIGETYVSQHIALHYSVSATVADFKGLSNNNWKVSKEHAHLAH